MGNACGGSLAKTSDCVISISASSTDELTFTDIDNAWQVANQGARKSKSKTKPTVEARTSWKTVRVFVSSTFRDFDAEREVLVKKVFPDLREWCQSRRLHLVDIDLRWGVPKDSTTESTLRTCLGEIDRCFNENLQPFFVNMTSERIGWIPLGNQLPPALKKEYRWVDGLSVTEMEILHGAYRIDNPNALFMIRDPSFLETVPLELHNHFVDECGIAPYKLEKLKKNIEDRFGNTSRVVTYKSEYSHVDPHTKMPRFKDLGDNFASVILTFFQERIAAQYPLIDDKKQDPFEEAKTQHESFMKMASERVVGRDVLVSEFVNSYIRNTNQNSPVVIYGGPGLGKTSIMAALTDKCSTLAIKHQLPVPKTAKRWRIFCHFVGAVAGSTDQLSMLTRLLIEIKALGKNEKKLTALDEAMSLVRGALSNPRTKNCIIVVDAMNQFDDFHGKPAPISWLPSKMSPTVRIFVSLTPESNQFKLVQENGDNWTFLQLQPLDRETKEQMVTSQLARYNKQLDGGQLELLLNKRSSDNPMWLSLATEELRIFGRFRELTNKIGTLPDGLPELENEILARFERESDDSKLIATLCLLECSVRGLLESELLELLVAPELLPPALMSNILKLKDETSSTSENVKQERLTAAQWADVYRVLRPFMRPFGASGEGRLDFYHRSLSKAVRNRYFNKVEKDETGAVKKTEKREDVVKFFHRRLADYFGGCKNLERKVEEYPMHAWKSGDSNALKTFLCDWEVFDALFNPDFARELSSAWEHVHFMSEANKKNSKHVFRELEECYVVKVDELMKTIDEGGEENKKTVVKRMERVSLVLSQNGCFAAARTMANQLMNIAFPANENDQFNNDLHLDERDYKRAGQHLPPADRLQYARYQHIIATVVDEELRKEAYASPNQVPSVIEVIEAFEKAIAIFTELSPEDDLLGCMLNRCSYYYSDLVLRGGCKWIDRTKAAELAEDRINKAIDFYKAKGGLALNLADCYITLGSALKFTDIERSIDYYFKAERLILDTAGPLHPLMARVYMNIGNYYKKRWELDKAYQYYRRLYVATREIFGPNHTRTVRVVELLNEHMFRRLAIQRGDEVPTFAVEDVTQSQKSSDSDDDSEDDEP